MEKLAIVLARLERIDWYGRVGFPVDEADETSVRNFLVAFGFPGCRVNYVADLEAVKIRTRNEFSPQWFEIEEEFRRQLTRSIDASKLDLINSSLRTVIDPMSEHVMEAAQRNLACDELQVLKAAAGCAIEVCYQYAMETVLSSSMTRIFSSKITIFEQGRWPLTAYNDEFYVY